MDETDRIRRQRLLARAVLGLILVLAGYLIITIARRPDRYQWDFRVYYYAARGYPVGVDPYNPEQVQRFAPACPLLPFVYPPLLLKCFGVFAGMPYDVAYEIWLGIKIVALIALILLWRRYLFRDEPSAYFAVFLFLGFSSAIYLDLVTGNISILEQFLLWSGLVLFLQRKLLAFAALVILASLFKFTPIVFLALLLFTDIPHRWRYLIGSLAVFAGLVAMMYLANPDLFGRFLSAAWHIQERGIDSNPSLLSFIQDVGELLVPGDQVRFHPAVPMAAYGLAGVGILYLSLRAWQRLRVSPEVSRTLVAVYLFCVTYALIVPRLKTYSFILLLPPAFYVLRRSGPLSAFPFLLVLFSFAVYPPLPTQLPLHDPAMLLWLYYPLMLAFLVWGLLMRLAVPSRPLAAVTVGADG